MTLVIKIIFALILFGLSIIMIVKKVKDLKMYNSYLYDAYYTLSPKEKKKQLNSVKLDIVIYILYAIYSISIIIFDFDFFIYSIFIATILYTIYIDTRI